MAVKMSRTWATNHCIVTVSWDDVRKKGPGWSPLRLMYCTTACTGQRGVSVRPTITSTPDPNWSHLDFLRCTLNMEGSVMLLTARSPQDRFIAGLKPSRKNPKKANEAMAHSTAFSGLSEVPRYSWICLRTWAVRGRRMRLDAPE